MINKENLLKKEFWTFKEFVYITLSSLLMFFFFVLLAMYFNEIENYFKSLIINFGLIVSILSPVILFLHKKGVSLNMYINPNIKFIKWFLYSLILAILVVVVGGSLTNIFNNFFGIDNTTMDVLQFTLSDNLILNLIDFKLFVGILIPISEEIYFRGVLYKFLRQKYLFITSSVISALIFTLVHFSFSSIFFLLFLGLFSSWIYEKSGSLIPSIIIHIFVNTLAVNFVLMQ
ncbi:MAG TPA: type II CAAX endopeptidase family protein [Candidatus Paceibacterota bacterium]|nr:type II CAAX endopeptidase family protein [Candidatus Paceibacterota bacterium]HMP18882.1 type II CAAX endopeptidase family protein [Candidatus Paceibacterota bacterium]HMP85043.1 type II CAAX endopeptidase family protein [Candidatus Paceibacterota bacterium]